MVSYVWLYWLTVSWTSLDSETGRNKNKTSWVIAKRFSIFEVRFTTFDSVEGSYYKGPRLNVEKVLTSVMLRSAQNFAFRVLTGTGNDYEPQAVTSPSETNHFKFQNFHLSLGENCTLYLASYTKPTKITAKWYM